MISNQTMVRDYLSSCRGMVPLHHGPAFDRDGTSTACGVVLARDLPIELLAVPDGVDVLPC
jgi:hypothetical protein